MTTFLLAEALTAILALALISLGVSTNSLSLVAPGAMALACVGGLRLWLTVARREQYWSFCDIHAASLLIAYFGGAAVTLWLSQGGVIQFWNAPDLGLFLAATLYVVFFAAALRLWGAVEHRFWRRVWHAEHGAPEWSILVTVGLALLGAAQLYMLATGAVSYKGTAVAEGWKVPYTASFIAALSWPLTGLCGWVCGRAELRRVPHLFLTCCALLPVQLFFNFGYGRRILLFQGIVFMVLFVWARGRGFRPVQLIAMSVFGLPTIYVLWIVFLALRIDSYSDPTAYSGVASSGSQRNIFERLDSTSDILVNQWDSVRDRSADDVVDRAFVIGYLTDLMGGTRPQSPFYGAVTLSEALTAVPRAMLPAKKRIIDGLARGEDSVNPRFGLPPTDRATTVVTSAYADFLWFGPVLIPPLVMALGVLLAKLATAGGSPFFRVCTLAYTLLFALQVEEAFFTANLVMARTLFAGAVLLVAVTLIRRSANPSVHGYGARMRS